MGLFKKEYCVLCGEEVGVFGKAKLTDGMVLCSDCVSRTGLDTNALKGLNPEEVKKRIEYHENDINENLERISQFNATYQVGGFVWFDDNNKWFVIPRGTFRKKIDNSYVFKYEEIIDFEVIEDGTTVTKGGLGKALVGGALFGLAGAIVGGTSKKTKEICNRLDIKITTRNQDRPIEYINIINSQTKKKSFIYKETQKRVQEILSKFQIIIDMLEQEGNMKKVENNNSVSIADEILKLKELLDMEAITKEEYEMMKNKILNK